MPKHKVIVFDEKVVDCWVIVIVFSRKNNENSWDHNHFSSHFNEIVRKVIDFLLKTDDLIQKVNDFLGKDNDFLQKDIDIVPADIEKDLVYIAF